jgi:hypothetical protein
MQCKRPLSVTRRSDGIAGGECLNWIQAVWKLESLSTTQKVVLPASQKAFNHADRAVGIAHRKSLGAFGQLPAPYRWRLRSPGLRRSGELKARCCERAPPPRRTSNFATGVVLTSARARENTAGRLMLDARLRYRPRVAQNYERECRIAVQGRDVNARTTLYKLLPALGDPRISPPALPLVAVHTAKRPCQSSK